MYKFNILWLSIFLFVAGYVQAVVVIDYSLDERDMASGCSPPMVWADEHKCSLSYPFRDYTVGKYECGDYTLMTDCRGNVTSFYNRVEAENKASQQVTKLSRLFVVIIILIYIIFLVWTRLNKRRPYG